MAAAAAHTHTHGGQPCGHDHGHDRGNEHGPEADEDEASDDEVVVEGAAGAAKKKKKKKKGKKGKKVSDSALRDWHWCWGSTCPAVVLSSSEREALATRGLSSTVERRAYETLVFYGD